MEQNREKASSTPTLRELTNELESVRDWHSLGVKLDLKAHELGGIEISYRGDITRCRTEMLSRWLDNTTNPTWEAVAEALRRMRANAVASTIERKYILHTATTEVPLGESPLTSPVTSSPLPSPITNDSHIPAAVVPPTSQLTTPPHQPTPGHIVASAKDDLRNIKQKFTSVLLLARTVLQNNNISVLDLQLVLAASYVPDEESNDTSGINPSRFICDVLGTAQNIGEAFVALMREGLLGFKNYHVLRPIIDNYAGEISAKLDEYEDDLGGYFLVTKLRDYLDAELEESEQAKPDPKLLHKLSLELDVKVTDKSMKYVSDLWKSLGCRIKLPLSALPLHKVVEGCVEIVWLLPSHLTRFATIQVKENTNYFREENVLRVTIAGRCIYEEETNPRKQGDPNDGNKGVVQASEPDCEEVHERTKKEDPESRGDPDAGNLSIEQRIQQLEDDEPEDPEAIPEHEQSMKCVRVIRTNYSLLYGHLDTRRLLPKLPDKDLINDVQLKAAESYQQRFAQNAILIDALLKMDRPSNGLLKFCDTLETTPGQEHIAKKLLRDYKHAIKHPSAVSIHRPLPRVDTAVHSDLSETLTLFQELQLKVMDVLDHFPNALTKLKQVLASVVLPLGEGKTAPLVEPHSYEGAHTVRELFRLMSPYWNPLNTDLLSLLLEGSGYNQAADKVAEFVESRGGKGHDVLCIRQLPILASGQNDLDVSDLETVHYARLSDLQSLHPAVFARLPEHKVTSERKTIRISAEVDKSFLCVVDYEVITTALSGFFQLPKAGLVYSGCCKAPLVLCWQASHELSAYFTSVQIGISGHRLVVESGVTRVAVGDRVYKCPTLKEVELLEACLYGLVRQVPYLLRTGANVNVTDFNGWTAIKQASFSGHQKVVELLLRAGANPDLQDKNGRTALEIASFRGHQKVVELLLGAGANPDLQDKDGFFPLYWASQNGYIGIVNLLIQAGARVYLQNKNGSTALKQASFSGHQKVVELLLGAGANPDLQDKDGFFPLYCASQEGYIGIVDLLIQAGARVDLQNKVGWTALEQASSRGHQKVVELLLGAGANPDLQDKYGMTALEQASLSGHQKVVELLLGAGANPDLQDKDGFFPLYCASQEGYIGIVNLLIQAGARVDLQNKDGATPLYIACEKGHLLVAEHLIQAKSDINHQKEGGHTVLMVASGCGHPSVVRALLQAGATVNTTNQVGETALHLAVHYGHEDVVELLLEANADSDLPKKGSQETALMVAAWKGSMGIVRRLIKHGAQVNLTNKTGLTAFDIASAEGHSDVCQELLTQKPS